MRLPRGLLIHRHLPWLVAALALVLTLPALSVGIVLDDWFQRSRFLGLRPFPKMAHPIRDLFVFVPREGPYARALDDILGWWKTPDLELVFYRPLSAATQLLDWRLWPDAYWIHHLHSLGWFALAIAAVAWTYRQTMATPMAAGLAALLFAVEDAHGLPAAWLANRNALLALLFGALALGMHVRWRKGGGTAWCVGSCWALTLGLFSGESALEATAYLFAWEVFLGRERWTRRFLHLVPAGLVTLGWRLVYNAMGCRTWGSGHYIDPGRQPLEFIREVPVRSLVLALGQWTQIQTDLYIAMPRTLQLALVGLALVVVVLLAAVFGRTLKEEAEARFWAVGSLLALVPACATFPMDRLLTFSGIGAFGLLALQVSRLGWLGAPAIQRSGRGIRWATGGLMVLHLVLAPPLLAIRSVSPRLLFGILDESVKIVPPDAPIEGETWVVVNGFDLFVAYLPLIRGGTGQTVPRATEMLASVMADMEITRPDERTLVIRPDGGWLRHDMERLVRAPGIPFTAGQRIRRETMEAEILEITLDGRPAVVAFHFDAPLEDPSIRWLESRGFSMVPFVPPAVGEVVRIAGSAPAGAY